MIQECRCEHTKVMTTAILNTMEGLFQVFQRFSSSKLVLKTVGSRFAALNCYEHGSRTSYYWRNIESIQNHSTKAQVWILSYVCMYVSLCVCMCVLTQHREHTKPLHKSTRNTSAWTLCMYVCTYVGVYVCTCVCVPMYVCMYVCKNKKGQSQKTSSICKPFTQGGACTCIYTYTHAYAYK